MNAQSLEVPTCEDVVTGISGWRAWVVRAPLRPRPHAGESAYGYLIRAAEANGFESPRQFWRAIKRESWDSVRLLRLALRLSRHELESLLGRYPSYTGIRFESAGIDPGDLNCRSMRWCPSCLAESRYLRAEWSIKLCCACGRHETLLRDRCPRCGQPQLLERADLSRCACGWKFDGGLAAPASSCLADLHKMLVEKRSPFGGELTLKQSEWVRLVKRLGQLRSVSVRLRTGQMAGLRHLERAIKVADATAYVLAEWPTHFRDMLDSWRDNAPQAAGIGSAFGRVCRVLYRELSSPCFQFLRIAFEDYLHDNWFGLLGRRHRRLSRSTTANHPCKPARSIAEQAGTSKAVVRRLARAGVILGRESCQASGRVTWAIPEAEASRVSSCVEDRLNLRDAAYLLGLSRPRVRELIDAGLLQAWVKRSNAGASTWWLSRTSANELIDIWSCATDVGDGSDAIYVSLGSVLRTWQLQGDEFPALIRAIRAMELTAVRATSGRTGISALLLNANRAQAWLDRHRCSQSDWVSIDVAAGRLGLKQQVAYDIVARGLLPALEMGEGARRGRRVHPDGIQRFRNSYVALSEIAHVRGTSPRALRSTISATPVCGPAIDGARQYFYRRVDVADVLSSVRGADETVRGV